MLSASWLASAQQFSFETIDIPGATRTAANGLSEDKLAGEFDDADGNTHGFKLGKHSFKQIDVPGAVMTTANSINEKGEIVGIYAKSDNILHGFFKNEKGVVTAIDPPSSIRTIALGLNDLDHVVGQHRTNPGEVCHGYL